MKLGLPFGISTTFWFLMGLLRALIEDWQRLRKTTTTLKKKSRVKPSDIAVILPAHNEELVIKDCIRALKQSVKKSNIYIVSDGSTDRTYERAKEEGYHVVERTGQGKAKALVYAIEHFNLYKKYKVILIIDADTQVDKDFFKNALPLFDDPEVSVVFAGSRIHWPRHIMPRLRYYFIAYRERLNRMLQFFIIFGQTWKYTNTIFVIPGFATFYRTNVLKKLKIDTPGLVIEDFNLAFQFHKKRLGTVAYHPSIIGWDQYPDNLVDYWKQVRRWNIGFFQTVRRNGVWPSFFWLSVGIFSLEVFINSVFVLLLPLLILSLILPIVASQNQLLTTLSGFYQTYGPFHNISLLDIFIGVFFIDYGMTVVFGLIGKKPQLIFYGLFFFFLHYITSLILVTSVIPGFFKSSDGRWISPKRLADESV